MPTNRSQGSLPATNRYPTQRRGSVRQVHDTRPRSAKPCHVQHTQPKEPSTCATQKPNFRQPMSHPYCPLASPVAQTSPPMLPNKAVRSTTVNQSHSSCFPFHATLLTQPIPCSSTYRFPRRFRHARTVFGTLCFLPTSPMHMHR